MSRNIRRERAVTRITYEQYCQIDAAIEADYVAHNQPFERDSEGRGLFHVDRIDFHTRRVLGLPDEPPRSLEFWRSLEF